MILSNEITILMIAAAKLQSLVRPYLFLRTRWVSEAPCWSRWTSKRTGSMTSSRCALLGFHIKFDQIPSSTCDLPSVYRRKKKAWFYLLEASFFLMYRLYRLVLFLLGAVYNLTYHGSAFSAFSTPPRTRNDDWKWLAIPCFEYWVYWKLMIEIIPDRPFCCFSQPPKSWLHDWICHISWMSIPDIK